MAEIGEGPSPSRYSQVRSEVDINFGRIEGQAGSEPVKLQRKRAFGNMLVLDLGNTLKRAATKPEELADAAIRVLTAAKHEAYDRHPEASQHVLKSLLIATEVMDPEVAALVAPLVYEISRSQTESQTADNLKQSLSQLKDHLRDQGKAEAASAIDEVIASLPENGGQTVDEPPTGDDAGGGRPPESPPPADTPENGAEGEDEEEEAYKKLVKGKTAKEIDVDKLYALFKDELELITSSKKEDEGDKFRELTSQLLWDQNANGLIDVLGWDRQKVETLIFAHQAKFGTDADARIARDLEEYGILPGDLKIFNDEYLIENMDQYFDSDGSLRQGAKDEMTKAMYSAVNKLLQSASSNPDVDWQSAYNSYFEGQIERHIRNKILKLGMSGRLKLEIERRAFENAVDPKSTLDDFREFFTRDIVPEMDNEIDMRQMFHEMRKAILLGQVPPDKLAEYMMKFPAFKIGMVAQGYQKELIEIVMAEFIRNVDIRKNMEGNKLPPDLFMVKFDPETGKRLLNKDYERLKDVVRARLKVLAEDPNTPEEMRKLYSSVDSWEINRAMTIGMGIQMATLRFGEVLGSSDAAEHYKGQPGYAQYTSARHKWGLGRGGEIGTTRTPTIFGIPIKLEKEKGTLRKRIRKGWVPEKLYQAVHEKDDEVRAKWQKEVTDVYFAEGENTFRELLREFSLGGFFSRGGWRIDSLKNWYKEKFNSGVDENWADTYENLSQEIGVMSRWYFDHERIKEEVKKYSKSNKDPIFYDDSGHSIPKEEFKEEKEIVFKGMHFKALLDRSPLEFLSVFSGLEPELSSVVRVRLTDVDPVDRSKPKVERYQELTAYEYYFSDKIPNLHADEVKGWKINKDKYRGELAKNWGESNVPHLKKIAETYHNLFKQPQFDKEVARTDRKIEGAIDREAALHSLNITLGNAFTRVRNKPDGSDRSKMTASDILDTDEHGQKIRELFFGSSGLNTHFEGLNENFADNGETDRNRLGDKKFFYTAANRWSNYEQNKFIPSTNEMALLPFLSNLDELGPDVLKRVLGDSAHWNEVIDKVGTLPEVLKAAAASGKEDGIFELYAEVVKLKDIIGEDEMYKLNSFLATVVTRFFQENYKARFPFPFNFITGRGLGSKISLSQMYVGNDAMTWKTEKIRQHLHHAMEMGFLGSEERHQKWNNERIEKAVGADSFKYGLLEAGPSIAFLALTILLLQLAKKAMEEEKED